jgi:hypothetical protein
MAYRDLDHAGRWYRWPSGDSERMYHLSGKLPDRIGVLALREFLVSKIYHDEDNYCGAQYLHELPPNRLQPITRSKRQRLFELRTTIRDCGLRSRAST